MRSPSHSLPSDFLYSFAVTIIGLRILLTILTLIGNLIMGHLLASESLLLSLLLTLSLIPKYHDPQVTGMRTCQSSCNALVGCQVPLLLLRAMDLSKTLQLLSEEPPLEV